MTGDSQDGTVTDNQHKKWDPTEPIHRINSPAFNTGGFSTATGDGVSRGCRLPGGLQMTSQLSRVLPAWVPVQDNPYKEVEGKLLRSFQTWTDFPMFQWHRWYDWNFHVVPSQSYSYLRGDGNKTPGPHPIAVVDGPAMECEWDCGSFGSREGPMFMQDWLWPMGNQFVWIAGRWIYDCGHADPNNNKMRSELHPCCAVANARWEAQSFSSSAKQLFPTLQDPLGFDVPFVPGVQFMFFACKRGGYFDLPEVFDRDYTFIVDLPRETPGRTVAPIGPTPTNPQNTLVVGPLRIVASVSFDPFSNATTPINNSLQPVLDVIVPADGSSPNQVKVTIPLSQLKGTPTNSYGVMISFGVFDQFLALAKRIVKITGSFDTVQFFGDFGDVDIKCGINGRWARRGFQNVKSNDTRPINFSFSFALSVDHPPNGGGPVLTSSHGKIFKKVGTFLQNTPDAGRILRVGNQSSGRAYEWGPDIVNPQNDTSKTDELEITLADALKSTATITHRSGEQNLPLGIADLARKAKDLFLAPSPFDLKGAAITEDEHAAELFFKGDPDPNTFIDYKISGTINSQPQ